MIDHSEPILQNMATASLDNYVYKCFMSHVKFQVLIRLKFEEMYLIFRVINYNGFGFSAVFAYDTVTSFSFQNTTFNVLLLCLKPLSNFSLR